MDIGKYFSNLKNAISPKIPRTVQIQRKPKKQNQTAVRVIMEIFLKKVWPLKPVEIFFLIVWKI